MADSPVARLAERVYAPLVTAFAPAAALKSEQHSFAGAAALACACSCAGVAVAVRRARRRQGNKVRPAMVRSSSLRGRGLPYLQSGHESPKASVSFKEEGHGRLRSRSAHSTKQSRRRKKRSATAAAAAKVQSRSLGSLDSLGAARPRVAGWTGLESQASFSDSSFALSNDGSFRVGPSKGDLLVVFCICFVVCSAHS